MQIEWSNVTIGDLRRALRLALLESLRKASVTEARSAMRETMRDARPRIFHISEAGPGFYALTG
jgi:glycine/D-amino acid oxidase-like deaminating enzyme